MCAIFVNKCGIKWHFESKKKHPQTLLFSCYAWFAGVLVGFGCDSARIITPLEHRVFRKYVCRKWAFIKK
jgi:hypothetical protein